MNRQNNNTTFSSAKNKALNNTGEEPINQYDEKEEMENTEPFLPKRTPRSIRLTALFIVVAFAVVFSLGSYSYIFSWFTLDFLVESRQLSQDPRIQELQKAVVEIEVIPRGQAGLKHSKGTGFNISPEGFIITNLHLIDEAAVIKVSFPGQENYQAQKWFGDPAADLAVILLNSHNQYLPVIELANKEPIPKLGDKVTVIGNPLGFRDVVIQGNITGYRKAPGLTNYVFEIAAPIHPGHSGSPVFNENYQVIGVIFATVKSDSGESRGLAIPAAQLQTLVN